MQAVILAAGKGSRLGEITKNLPKSFLEIEGRKIIEYNINMLNKYGVTEIIIVTGYKSEKFEALFKDRNGIKIIYNPFYEISNVLTSFWTAQENLNDDFIYMHADTLCDTYIFEKLLKKNGDIVLPVDFGVCDEEAMKVSLVDDRIKYINKTMKLENSDGEFIGIAKVSKKCLNCLKKVTIEIMKEKNFSAFFEVALQKIIDDDLCKIETVSTDNAFWCEIDFLEDLQRAKKEISNNLLKL